MEFSLYIQRIMKPHSPQWYRTVLDTCPDPLVVYDKNGLVLYINLAFSRVYGWTANEINGHQIDFVPENVKDETKRKIRDILSGKTVVEFDSCRNTKTGESIDVDISGSPLFDDGGNFQGAVVTHRDITRRKKTEALLTESEEKHRTALDAAPDPIVLYDMNGLVLYANPAFCQVFGWTLEELKGKRVDFVPDSAWPETIEYIEKVKRGESFYGFKTQRLNKKGDILDISMSAAVWRDTNDIPKGSIITLRDISKQLQKEKQLQHARKMEAVGTLAGGVAHDFNNILQAISGYTQLLLLKHNKPEIKSHLTGIQTSVKRASELVKQLLTASRKFDSNPRPIDVNDEIMQTVNLLANTIPKMISIETRLSDNIPIIVFDPTQLQQILLNLANNARDAMQDGGRLLFENSIFRTDETQGARYAELQKGEYILLSISDTGSGIKNSIAEHIFEPFFTTKPVGKGTGLGLSTVYGILKNHGGHITCDSEAGRGTTFRIFLPVAANPQAVEEKEIEQSEQSDLLAAYGGNERILLVDDETVLLESAAEMLKEAGYSVLTAETGEQAISLLRSEVPSIDLVILDLNMPGMGGNASARELIKINPQIKIIISTGYSEDLHNQLSSRYCQGFIGKPYQFTEMLQMVRKVMDKDSL